MQAQRPSGLSVRVLTATPDVAQVSARSTLRSDQAVLVQVATYSLGGRRYSSLFVQAEHGRKQLEVIWRLTEPLPADQTMSDMLKTGALEHQLVPRVLEYLQAQAMGLPAQPRF